mmetsp:Transcript_58465/g.143000  ORF Transcript_58465/g.143000 Transcript_58465/m.143000 type:complete len:861 (+) Transcript_58465:464-3046(+)
MAATTTTMTSSYNPPSIAVVVGNILRAPRTINHHGNFSMVFSTQYEEQRDYVDGILIVETVFLMVFAFWAFIQFVLKFKGKEVGCASGRAFVLPDPDCGDDDDHDDDGDVDREYDEDDSQYYDDSDDEFNNRTRTTVRGHSDREEGESLPFDEYLETTSESSGCDDENRPSNHWEESSSVGSGEGEDTDGQTTGRRSPNDDEDNDSGIMKKKKSTNQTKKKQKQQQNVGNIPTGNQLPPTPKTNVREFRTRICFLFFAMISLACIPLILVFSFGPMKDATTQSEEITLDVQNMVDQVNSFLQSIEVGSINALDTVSTTPTDLQKICPNVAQDELENVLGIDLMEIINQVADEYDRLKQEVSSQLAMGNAIADQVQTGITTFEVSVDETEQYLWIIPGLLFGVGILTAISILGVILAWKDRSGSRFQCTMSWVILPLLCTAMMACWGCVMAYSFSSMVGTDACTSSSSVGSPDQTIQEVLSLHQLDQNSTIYQLASAYTNQCIGPDPTQQIQDVEAEIQGHIDTIWRQMSKLDSIGRNDIMTICGGETEAFTELVAGARNLARLLTGIRRSLDGMETTLQCAMINPIYVQTAHDVVCTETLTSTVYGFIFFLVLSVCVMVMISLRSSWLCHIQEEKVYHDEDDVAENMFLDEHEEYLAYISRYKHEWQEYGGFENEATAVGSHGDDEYLENESCFEDEEGFCSSSDGGEESIVSGINIQSVIDEEGIRAAAAAGAAAASLASEDISPFPSFDLQKSSDGSIEYSKEPFAVPPPLLEPPVHAYAIKDANGQEPDGIILASAVPATPMPVQSLPANLLGTSPNFPLARRSLSQISMRRAPTSITAEESGDIEVSALGDGFLEL